MSKLAVFIINTYQTFFSLDKGFFSLLVPGGACRFSPSCSEYTKHAILKHGLNKGLMLGARRLLSCR